MQADDFGPLAQAMAIALAVSACVSGGLRAACPRRRSILGMWLLAAAAPALAVFAVPAWRVYSYHGCFHIAVVSRILEGSVPPENPVFAGAPLLYPWSYHLTAALISAALGISPSWAFALLGIASLLATVSLLYAFALRATGDHATAVLSVTLALFAPAVTSAHHLAEPGLRVVFRGRAGTVLEWVDRR